MTNSQPSFLVIRIFYLFSFYVSCREILYHWSWRYIGSEWDQPVWLIEAVLELNLAPLIALSLSLQPIFALLCAHNPYSQTFRIGFAISIFVNLAAHLSDGREDIGYHPWLWTSIVLGTVGFDELKKRGAEKRILQLARAAICLPYFFSGLHKVFLGGLTHPDTLGQQLLGRIVKGYSIHPIGEWLLNWPSILYMTFIAGTILQIGQIFLLAIPRFSMIHGLLLTTFHVFTFLTLKILFPDLLWLVIIFFMSPYLLKLSEPENTPS